MLKICVVHQNDGTDVRVGKVCRTISKEKCVVFLGWDRDRSDQKVDLGDAKRELFVAKGSYGFRSIFVRVHFLLWTLCRVCVIKPDCIIAVNEELAFSLLTIKPFVRFKLIIDIHDPLADRIAKGKFHWFYSLIQAVARNFSDGIWVTDENRFQMLDLKFKAKTMIIPNYPNKPTFDLFEIYRKLDDRILHVAVVGSLNTNRGIQILRQAVERVKGIKLELAGWFTDDESKELEHKPYATFHGVLGMQDSLRLIASCDLIYCYYNPVIKNNINASPNKVYEAICVGKKTIINSETKISKWVVDNGFGQSCAYADVNGLCEIFENAKKNIEYYRMPNEHIVSYASKSLYWEVYEDSILKWLT